jgi:hypothetical protein
MFYKKEDDDLILLCAICLDVFQDDDPRILPCGQSACHKCIQKLNDNSESKFKCSFCNDNHRSATKKGFPLNLIALKLLRAKADKVYRNPSVDKLIQKLSEVKEKTDDLDANIANGVGQISEYCSQLRSQVHLQTDILLEQVHQFNESMIAEINNYEAKCMSSYNEKFAYFEKESKQFLANINKFHEENSKYLNEFKIDDTKVHNGLTLADKYLKILTI